MDRIYNYINADRIYDYNGIKFRHLATVIYNNKKYIAYEVLSTKEKYVEELVSSKVSDIIFGEDQLVYIKDDKIWTKLITVLQKENII